MKSVICDTLFSVVDENEKCNHFDLYVWVCYIVIIDQSALITDDLN